mmetsp:Transcript_17539/g.40422  ORF Transcript_17539/g.40422 Transcript_17539/m.40422 type:complete len:228 (+) Transcript_17539:947-1630(+)
MLTPLARQFWRSFSVESLERDRKARTEVRSRLFASSPPAAFPDIVVRAPASPPPSEALSSGRMTGALVSSRAFPPTYLTVPRPNPPTSMSLNRRSRPRTDSSTDGGMACRAGVFVGFPPSKSAASARIWSVSRLALLWSEIAWLKEKTNAARSEDRWSSSFQRGVLAFATSHQVLPSSRSLRKVLLQLASRSSTSRTVTIRRTSRGPNAASVPATKVHGELSPLRTI